MVFAVFARFLASIAQNRISVSHVKVGTITTTSPILASRYVREATTLSNSFAFLATRSAHSVLTHLPIVWPVLTASTRTQMDLVLLLVVLENILTHYKMFARNAVLHVWNAFQEVFVPVAIRAQFTLIVIAIVVLPLALVDTLLILTSPVSNAMLLVFPVQKTKITAHNVIATIIS